MLPHPTLPPIERTLKAVHLSARALGRCPTSPEIAEACAASHQLVQAQLDTLSRFGYTRLTAAGIQITDAGRAAARRRQRLIAA